MTTVDAVATAGPQPPTEYRITARVRAGDPATAEAATSTIDMDTTWGLAPTGLPGPAELLATAFAACLLKNLARTLDLLGFSYDEAEVEVTARQDSPCPVVVVPRPRN